MKNFSVADFIAFVAFISRAFVVISVWNTVVIMKMKEQKIVTSCPISRIVNDVLRASQVHVNIIYRDMLLLDKCLVLGGLLRGYTVPTYRHCDVSKIHVRTCSAFQYLDSGTCTYVSSVSIFGWQTCVTTWQPTTQLNLVCMLLTSELTLLHEWQSQWRSTVYLPKLSAAANYFQSILKMRRSRVFSQLRNLADFSDLKITRITAYQVDLPLHEGIFDSNDDTFSELMLPTDESSMRVQRMKDSWCKIVMLSRFLQMGWREISVNFWCYSCACRNEPW